MSKYLRARQWRQHFKQQWCLLQRRFPGSARVADPLSAWVGRGKLDELRVKCLAALAL